MEEKKFIERSKPDFDEKAETDKGLEAYKKILAHQREMCERLGLKVAYYVLPRKKDSDD